VESGTTYASVIVIQVYSPSGCDIKPSFTCLSDRRVVGHKQPVKLPVSFHEVKIMSSVLPQLWTATIAPVRDIAHDSVQAYGLYAGCIVRVSKSEV
jgi:hypothetical protein